MGDRPGLTRAPVEVILIGRHLNHRSFVRFHQVAAIDLRDLRIHHGLPVTAPARTLIDFAADPATTIDELDRALNEAHVLRLVTAAELDAAIARYPYRPGLGPLKALLADERSTGMTRSNLERRFKQLIRPSQLPWPLFNQHVLTYEVDVLWPDHRLIVELDGRPAHERRARFESDRRKDQRLVAAGYVVIRVTDRQLKHEPLAVLVRVAQALAIAALRQGAA